VWFELPLVLQPGAQHGAFNVHPSIAAMRVLVAESHPTSARIIGELLLEWGAICDFARTSRDALSMLRDGAASGKPYDLALLERDIGGSRINGVFHEISKDAAIRDTRLIVLGTYQDLGSVANSTIPDSAARLRKPVSLQQLHDAVAGITSSAGNAAEPEPSKAAAEIAAAGARILAVEDNAVNLHVLRTMLELMGCHVDAAMDGREGVGAAISGDYDLVFMDCQMPEVDGYEASRRIRREEQRRSVARATPIIALTANVKSGERERCLKAGMNDYMSKPFTEEQLSDMLRRHLNGARKRRARLPCAARPRGPAPLEGSTDNSVIDTKVIEKLRQLQERTKRDVLRETIHLFHESSQASLDALRTAVRAGDAAGIRNAAHSLKSSSYIVGAKRLGDLCRRLEEQARMNRTESSNDLLQRVEPEYKSVRDCLGSALTASG
jgi:CheY-like chemotaxis protein/HPt (histidine-containing phosphotransfer) domain-containing protein